ncbi:aminotransferase class I/II-fold pyridoxal phosphate-dependent enzyme [Hathewaya limosa]|uniref:Arginine/lysine/ornithine decarboxylase n=1 Tax=Hathewaya limosa TaxID=1536 RepID=A0ABU0JSM9_HATLI|nr:aminotransferase class V-fold PLP-dependent enzyme [Hathewaya limosa]MDQ0480106.1 arginine/lysine/ornithine decarboxylase [Hathewaya limosa]
MSQLPLIDGVLEYIKENNLPFTMPGHKSGRGFINIKEGKYFYEHILKGDITEVDGVDNLHNAEGIIKESLDRLKEYYGSKKSYYLVNGSTSGNLSMIFSTFNKGDKVILERNCHRSVMNGIIMRELNPVYLKNIVDRDFNAPFSLNREHFFKTLRENKDAKGIIITYPNYYGICVDLKQIINEAKKYNMKVLVDCAHGAHFGVIEELPQNPIKLGADMVVMSSHKTLPSLTQTAYLHVGDSIDLEKVDFYVSAFMSTSPSYVMMMSMEFGRFYLEQYGREQYTNFLKLCMEYREKINGLQGFLVLGNEHMYRNMKKSFDTYIDLTRFVIRINKGYSAHKLLDYLRKKKIQCEMSDGRNIILIPNPFNTPEDFERLYYELKKCKLEEFREEEVPFLDYNIPKTVFLPHEIMDKKKIKVHIKDSIGKICGKSIVPYPPGVPLVMPGEVIDKEAIRVIEYYIKNNLTVLGIEDEQLWII